MIQADNTIISVHFDKKTKKLLKHSGMDISALQEEVSLKNFMAFHVPSELKKPPVSESIVLC